MLFYVTLLIWNVLPYSQQHFFYGTYLAEILQINFVYSTACISFASWNHLQSFICERWSECPAQTPALTEWQYCLLAHLHKQRMYFLTLSTLFHLEVWKIMYSNQFGNLLCLVPTLVIFFFTVIFSGFVI